MNSKFVFFSGSKNAPPGTNTTTGERLRPGDNFSQLAAIPNWRQVLSNFYQCHFTYDGRQFTSAEHAWHYAKFKSIGRLAEATQFTLESGSALASAHPSEAKKQGRRLYKMSGPEIGHWGHVKGTLVNDILYSKFTQCPLALQVLLATGDAESWHSPQRSPTKEHWTHLEALRTKLRTVAAPAGLEDDIEESDQTVEESIDPLELAVEEAKMGRIEFLRKSLTRDELILLIRPADRSNPTQFKRRQVLLPIYKCILSEGLFPDMDERKGVIIDLIK